MEDLYALEKIEVSKNNIEDISPIKKLTNLISFWAGNNKIVNIDSLKDMKNLKSLNLLLNKIKDISPLRCLNLKTVFLQENQINDASCLAKLLENPDKFNINLNNQKIHFSNFEDVNIIGFNGEKLHLELQDNTSSGEVNFKFDNKHFFGFFDGTATIHLQ